ncbi:hypothetical protein [Paenibacillus thalictri]|nr:hypothetical protein [Paenibacillus thalictri]
MRRQQAHSGSKDWYTATADIQLKRERYTAQAGIQQRKYAACIEHAQKQAYSGSERTTM